MSVQRTVSTLTDKTPVRHGMAEKQSIHFFFMKTLQKQKQTGTTKQKKQICQRKISNLNKHK